MGVRKTTDFLEKFTWGLAGTVLVCCILITMFIPRHQGNLQQESEIKQQINDAPMANPDLLGPDFGTAQPEEESSQPE
jgi:preprotein translocase subunit SecG